MSLFLCLSLSTLSLTLKWPWPLCDTLEGGQESGSDWILSVECCIKCDYMQNHAQCRHPDLLFEILAPVIDKFPKLQPDRPPKCPNSAPEATFFAIFSILVQKSQIVNLDVSIVHDSAYNHTLYSTLHSKSSPSQTPDPPPGGHGGVKVISRSKSRSSYLN